MVFFNVMILSLVVALFYFLIKNQINDQNNTTPCNQDDNYKFMSSKTIYDLIGNKENFNDYEISNCEQVGYWHLSRHGGRYADREDIIFMNEFLPRIRNLILDSNNTWLCDEEKKMLKKWAPRMLPDDDNILTPNGKLLMKNLGKRMSIRFKSLKHSINNSVQINIVTTNITRTIQSAEVFLEGFLGDSELKPQIKPIKDNEDYLLKFPDLCQLFLKEIDFNSNACPEVKLFENSKISKELDDIISSRMNLDIYQIKKTTLLDTALKACQYEYLIDPSVNSIWCKFFDTKMLKTIEFREDIKYNCKYGYKYEISRLMTCDLIGNLVENLNTFLIRSINNSDIFSKKIQLLFSHSSTMLPFLSLLGIGRDENNFNSTNVLNENTNRKFRVSKLDPMNSNIAFGLYKCQNSKSNYTLRAFHNENLVKIDGCRSEDCDLFDFINYYDKFIKSCISTENVCKIK